MLDRPIIEELDVADFPARVSRRMAAAIVTRHFFPISHRTIEAWPVPWTQVNGRCVVKTTDLVAYARALLAAGPTLRGGNLRRGRSA